MSQKKDIEKIISIKLVLKHLRLILHNKEPFSFSFLLYYDFMINLKAGKVQFFLFMQLFKLENCEKIQLC